MKLQHLAATLAGLWAGVMIGVGYVSAPVIFRMLPDQRKFAGTIAGDTFAITAYISLALGAIILLLVRRVNKRAGFNTPNAPMLWVLAALALAIVGQFVIFPMVVHARDVGPGALSFGALHGISTTIYMLEIVCVLALNWSLYKPVQKPQGIESAVKPEPEEDEVQD